MSVSSRVAASTRQLVPLCQLSRASPSTSPTYCGWNSASCVASREALVCAVRAVTSNRSRCREITIDSATLANKALEVIEAHFLFGLPYDRIEVVVHPQSIVHSFVEFVDGSVVAQMSVPSMEIPVLYALTHPERAADQGMEPFDPVRVSPLTFEPVDVARFPALKLGIEAGKRGGAAPAVYNAANEQAVALFLAGRIRFGDIPRAISSALDKLGDLAGGTREELLEADAAGRRHVMELI